MNFNGKEFNLDEGIDLSIGVGNPERFVRAWYLDEPRIAPVRLDSFVGDISQGSAVNFKNVFFNPHAHGTHTETYGHVCQDQHPISAIHFPLLMEAQVISLIPREYKNEEYECIDQRLTLSDLKKALREKGSMDALIIRTSKEGYLNRDFSHSNPPYLEAECATYLRQIGVKHLLIDLPSVDREVDGGILAFHKAFWNVEVNPDKHRTITEFIHVPAEISDGYYALNLQVANFNNDAAPSRPIIYPKSV